MLLMRQLLQRNYTGKVCTYFEVRVQYEVTNGQSHYITACYTRQGTEEQHWVMQVVLPRTRDKDHDVYQFDYIMPRQNNIPLELVAATGLKYFQLYLKDEVSQKQLLDFCIGDMLEGM